MFLLVVVALRHTAIGRRPFPERFLAPAGLVVGLLSAIAGSAGPLGAAVFLGLRLPPLAYVASEAVTAVLMHLTKSFVYGRYAALMPADGVRGLALGGAMMIGSWTGRRLVDRLPEKGFDVLVEVLLALAASAVDPWSSLRESRLIHCGACDGRQTPYPPGTDPVKKTRRSSLESPVKPLDWRQEIVNYGALTPQPRWAIDRVSDWSFSWLRIVVGPRNGQ